MESEDEEEGWTIETKQVEWTFLPGEDVLEKLSKLYPFRSAYPCRQESPKPQEVIEDDENQDIKPQRQSDFSRSINECTKRSVLDLSVESIERLKDLILKDFRTETIRCIVMDDPDENNCVTGQLHFKNPEIQAFYESLSDWVSLIAIGQPSVKHIHRDEWVAVDYLGTWHRAIVNLVLSPNLITVKLVDHGVSINLPLSSMRPLPEILMNIPPRAMQCRLLGSTGEIYSGCILDAFPLPSSINCNGVTKEPLPLKIINRSPCNGSTINETTLHHTLNLDTSPTCSRRPPLPQQIKQEPTTPQWTGDNCSAQEPIFQHNNGVVLRESHPFVFNSEGESDIYDVLCRSYPLNVSSPLSTSESSSDVGSVFSETNGAISHVQRLMQNEENARVNNPPKLARSKSDHKTSAVSTLCCRIRSSVLRKIS